MSPLVQRPMISPSTLRHALLEPQAQPQPATQGHVLRAELGPQIAEFLACVLTIDGIDPQVPVAGTQVQVSYTLTNHTQAPVSGVVTGSLGGEQAVDQLAGGGSFQGQIGFNAPVAGTSTLDLTFAPAGAAPGQGVLAMDSTSLDVAAQYNVRIDQMKINNTRAAHNDTDYASLSACVGDPQAAGAQPLTASKALGDVNNGVHPIGLSVGPIALVPGKSPDLVVSLLIINSGYSQVQAHAQTILDTISTATKDILDVAYPEYREVWTMADAITQQLNALFTVNCDGIVASDKLAFLSQQLTSLTSNATDTYTQTSHYPGIDSGTGCGSNSDYYVTLAIERLPEGQFIA
jgi:hypothetical protein